jgi:hypothetical protein
MSIRWRLAVLFIQLGILLLATLMVTGQPFVAATWFAAGLLALIINPQLLEPFYTRPVDVLANSILGLLLYFTADRRVAAIGWDALAVVLVALLVLSIIALLFGAGREEGLLVGIARSATLITRAATSRVIWSIVFFLGLMETYGLANPAFWRLGISWAGISLIGAVNWQAVYGSLSGTPSLCRAEGMLGPSLLLVSAPTLPPAGTSIQVQGAGLEGIGLVISRIRRSDDVWGQLHLQDNQMCERFASGGALTITRATDADQTAVGVVLEASSDTRLQFLATTRLEVGQIVTVGTTKDPIYYQVRWAEIQNTSVKGGAHHTIRVHASQIGTVHEGQWRLTRYRWVPDPGGLVYLPRPLRGPITEPPEPHLVLGELVATSLPVYLDCDTACQGHVAILGMTRMGKTTLAHRLVEILAKSRRVTVIDQTGEWVGKRGFSKYAGTAEDSQVGVSVLEPKPGTVPADESLKYLQSIVKLAYAEYKNGNPLPRVLVLDEAHQFIPEPAGLPFSTSERESATKFGLLMMQVRKYGISVVLISQRTAVVAKSALSQCENVVAFKSVDQTGLDYLEAVLGTDARKALPSLAQGEALVFGPAISSDVTVGIRMRAP